MSKIHVDIITNRVGDGAVSFESGVNIQGPLTVGDGVNVSGILTASSINVTGNNDGNLNLPSELSATAFSGDGSNLTGLSLILATKGKVIAYNNLFSFAECFRS